MTIAYLDIETTGFGRDYADLTVIGVALFKHNQYRVRQLVGDQNTAQALLRILKGVTCIYTYNGSRFDLPFIRSKLGVDLKDRFQHMDLMYNCWHHNLKGGLKAVERKLGIKRQLPDIDGYLAVRLWWDYINNENQKALRTLLAYNREDVVNLHTLRRRLLTLRDY
jgi:uncharacterized protein YprB with RNaseH-like and TPR domain